MSRLNQAALASLALVLLVGGCSSNGEERPAYLDARSVKTLVLDNGMQMQGHSDQSRIPGIASHEAPSQSPDIHPPQILDEAQKQQQGGQTSRYNIQLLEDAQGTPYMIIQGEYEELWLALLQTLKRAGFNVEGADPARGHIVLKVKDISQKEQPVIKVRLVVVRAYQSVRVLVQEAEQPKAVAAPLARSILNIIKSNL
jgi:uncharacterized lipoprotein